MLSLVAAASVDVLDDCSGDQASPRLTPLIEKLGGRPEERRHNRQGKAQKRGPKILDEI